MKEDGVFFVALILLALFIAALWSQAKEDKAREAFIAGQCPVVITVPCGGRTCEHKGMADCDAARAILVGGEQNAWHK